MDRYLTPRQYARIAALGFIVLIATLAVSRGQRGEDTGIIAPLEREEADALASEIARCRTVTVDQAVSLENCRRVWAENRRQFFKSTKATPAPAESIATATTVSGKNQERVSPVEAEHQQSGVR